MTCSPAPYGIMCLFQQDTMNLDMEDYVVNLFECSLHDVQLLLLAIHRQRKVL